MASSSPSFDGSLDLVRTYIPNLTCHGSSRVSFDKEKNIYKRQRKKEKKKQRKEQNEKALRQEREEEMAREKYRRNNRGKRERLLSKKPQRRDR